MFAEYNSVVARNIKGKTICFIWRGEWAEPQIAYCGKLLNQCDVEDMLPEHCDEPTDEEWHEATMDAFYGYAESDVKLDDFTAPDTLQITKTINV